VSTWLDLASSRVTCLAYRATEPKLTGGLEELIHHLAVGAALEPLPDEPGQAIAAMGVVEPVELDQ
jgi:hypothetical protein